MLIPVDVSGMGFDVRPCFEELGGCWSGRLGPAALVYEPSDPSRSALHLLFSEGIAKFLLLVR